MGNVLPIRSSTPTSAAVRRFPAAAPPGGDRVPGHRRAQERDAGRGLTQTQLADLAQVDQGDSRFEAGKWGKRGISYEMLDRILPVVGFRLEHSVVDRCTSAIDDGLRWQHRPRRTASSASRLCGFGELTSQVAG